MLTPDDVELAVGGSVARLVAEGKSVGIVDLTRGELGTRGSAELRDVEAMNSAGILGVSSRHNLRMLDGFFENSQENQIKIIEQIRRYRPEIVLCNAIEDRHPDHGRGARLTADACFLSGLRKIETEYEGVKQEHWRPRLVLHYIQDYYVKPDFVWDVTDYFEIKMKAIGAFSSQFHNPDSTEPATPISGKGFLEMLNSRAIDFGRPAGFELAEGFTISRIMGVQDIFLNHVRIPELISNQFLCQIGP